MVKANNIITPQTIGHTGENLQANLYDLINRIDTRFFHVDAMLHMLRLDETYELNTELLKNFAWGLQQVLTDLHGEVDAMHKQAVEAIKGGRHA